MGEVVKHGLIKNREYYQWLKDNHEGIAAGIWICARPWFMRAV